MKKRAFAVWMLLFLVLASSALAEPAVYRVRGPEGGQMYLMGTLHAGLAGDTLPAAAKEAAGECTLLVLEADPGEMEETDPAFLQQAARLFLPAGVCLSDLIGPDLTEQCAAALGMRRAALERFVPYGAVSLLSERDNAALSLDPDWGADRLLYALALEKGMGVYGIETVEEQMDALLSLDTSWCAEAIRQALSDPGGCIGEVSLLRALWLKGDEQGLEALFEREEDDPEAERVLVTQRNLRFRDAALSFLSGEETVFMAVGCAHLYGEEGLIRLMENAQCHVERLPSDTILP